MNININNKVNFFKPKKNKNIDIEASAPPSYELFQYINDKTWCVGGRHYSNTNNIYEYEKVNPKTKKLVKITKGTCSICGRNKSQTFTK